MKTIKLWIGAAALSLMITACEDGDPGPKGAQGDAGAPGQQGPQGEKGPDGLGLLYQKGVVTANISGTRKFNGTAFNASIELKYTDTDDGSDVLFEDGGNHYLSIYRTSEISSHNEFFGTIKISKKDQPDQKVTFEEFDLEYYQDLGNGTLFELKLNSPFIPYDVVYPVPQEENASTYHFAFTSPTTFGSNLIGFLSDGEEYDSDLGDFIQFYRTTDGSKVYFTRFNNYDNIHKVNYGTFVKVVDKDGNASETSEVYDDLILAYKNSFGYYFYNTAWENLSETGKLQDEAAITNYVHDSSSGIITFDYAVTINNPLFWINSTGKPVTITGKVTSELIGEILE